MTYDPQALADAETYLINFLEHSDPARDASLYEISQAARDYHDTTGDWDLSTARKDLIEGLLARHAK